MESQFRLIVEQIFNNWTGLQLAVEHSLVGSNSRQVAIECVDYMTQYCLNQPNIQVSDIQEALEDIMDEEFETICEDNSPNEIAHLLHHFLLLIKGGDIAKCELEYQKLPTCELWLCRQQPETLSTEINAGLNLQCQKMEENDVMDENSEWIEVKSRKKK